MPPVVVVVVAAHPVARRCVLLRWVGDAQLQGVKGIAAVGRRYQPYSIRTS